MKSAVESLSSTRVKLTVEVPFGELKPSLDAAYKKIAGQVRVAGFRPGRVPPRIIDQRIGRGHVLEEAVNEAVPRFYGEAVRQNELQPVANPALDVTEFDDGRQLVFTAEVDVRPAIELPDIDGLPVTVDDVEVTDEQIDEQIATLRDRFAVLSDVERAAARGDYVTIDLEGSLDGEPLDDATAKGLSYEVGGGGLVEGLDDAIVGLSAGESATFRTPLTSGEHAGRDADLVVAVTSVKDKQLPDLDDEFAQSASEFDTLDELRADIRRRLERVRRLEQGAQARDRVLEALLERVDVPLPESLVETEVQWRRDNMAQQLQSIGMTLEQYAAGEGRSEQDVTGDIDKSSRDAVRAQFLLDAVAGKEQLGVTDQELTEHIVRRAQQAGMAPQEFANQVVEQGQVGMLAAEVLRGKALATVLERAKVTDASGREVDLSLLEDADIEGDGEDAAYAEEPDATEQPAADEPAGEPAGAEDTANAGRTAD